jgi:hypothetical protein
MRLSVEQRQTYQDKGYVLFARAASKGIDLDQRLDLDEAFETLCQSDRKLGGDIYDHAKELPEFSMIMSDRNIISLMRQLLGKKCFKSRIASLFLESTVPTRRVEALVGIKTTGTTASQRMLLLAGFR